MSDQYVGEIRMFAGNYAPQGWYLCDGQILEISGNEVLYSLIGVTYGGNGTNTFALPDLRGRLPIHTAQDYPLGSMAGEETVRLLPTHIPPHTHAASAQSSNSDSANPTNQFWGNTSGVDNYLQDTAPNNTMDPLSIGFAGNSEAHDNMMPYRVINFIIAGVGNYPSSDSFN